MQLRHPVLAIATFMIAVVLISESWANPQSHTERHNDATSNLGGRYKVSGTNPDGGVYTGNLDVIERGGVYQFRWNAGTQYEGVGLRNGRIVAVAFANGNDGSGCGVVNYTVRGDGTLQGTWGYWGTSVSGTESARRVSGRGLEGEYSANGTNPDGQGYRVNISVRSAGRGYKFAWSNKSEGFGIQLGDTVVVGIGDERCGFVAYEIKSDGSLDGVWGGYGSQLTGTEKATKQ
jgi:hypothetical protein